MPVYTVLPGTVVSADRVEIASRLTGYVHGLEVHEGQKVKQGQLLLTVDPTGVEAQIRQAEAELAKAEANLINTRTNYERYKKLYRERAATGQQYQDIETAYKVAQEAQQAAQAALAGARSQLKYAEVHAPFDGLVVSKLVDNGQLATPGAPLLVLENPSHLQVQVQMTEQAFLHVEIGRQIQVELEGSDYSMQTISGTVERLVAAADPVTHTHLAKIGLPPDSGAYSGEYAVVSIPIAEHEGIIVPSIAIHNRAGITGVFVVDAQNRARFSMVTLGKHLPTGTVVLSGLFPGDRVVVSAEGSLVNGVEIRAQKEGGRE